MPETSAASQLAETSPQNFLPAGQSSRHCVSTGRSEAAADCLLWPIVVQQIHVSLLLLPPLLLISLCVQGNSSLVLLALFSLSLSFQMLIWLAARWRRGRSDPLTFALTRHAGLPPSFCQRPFKDLTGVVELVVGGGGGGMEQNIKQVPFPARAEPFELETNQTNC